LQCPEFNLLIRPHVIYKKMPRRREDDPSTWEPYLIIDGLKL